MGGNGSGTWYRWGKKTTLDECRNIDINRMQKMGAIKPDTIKSGVWQWVDVQTGEVVSSISYTCKTLYTDHDYINLRYTFTDSNEGINYDIKLVKTYPHYGGVRYWFICPVTGKRVAKLYLTPYDGRFISRHVHKLLYASQSEGFYGRLANKRHRLMRKLDKDSSFPMRPKGMHHKTYDRIAEQVHALDNYVDYLLCTRLIKHSKK